MDFENADLWRLRLPIHVLDLMPESVVRENMVVPLGVCDGTLWVAAARDDQELREKLQFILNRSVHVMLRPKEQILHAIDCNYPLL